jgi:hypothetical protein
MAITTIASDINRIIKRRRPELLDLSDGIVHGVHLVDIAGAGRFFNSTAGTVDLGRWGSSHPAR